MHCMNAFRKGNTLHLTTFLSGCFMVLFTYKKCHLQILPYVHQLY